MAAYSPALRFQRNPSTMSFEFLTATCIGFVLQGMHHRYC